MKGSNKQFAMYLDSEYNDYSLEAHIKEKEKHDPEAKIKSAIQATTKPLPENSNVTSNVNNSPPKAFQQAPDMIPLTDDTIKEFLALLNDEALTWFEQLEAIERVGTEVLEAFKELYTKFQTVPVLFLSNVFGKGIYLWQVNRLCPYRKESNHMILDSKGLKGETKPNISILMLAKIVVEEDERIISAGIAGGNQICVRSRVREEEEVVRCYRIKDFAEIARINPYKQYILGNDRYSHKLVFKKANIEENGKHRVEVSLWKKKTGEEIQKEIAAVSKEEQEGEVKPILKDKLIQADTSLDLHITAIQNGFKEFGGTKNDVGFLFDKGYTSLVAWREDILLVKNFNVDQTTDWKIEENTMAIKLRGNQLYYQILFEVFPYLEFSANNKIEYTYFYQFNGPNYPLRLRKPILATDPMRYTDKENLVYDVPLSVINPYFVKEDNKQEKGEEEKQEEVPKKSMEKIKGELRQIKNERGDIKVDLKSTKELMKEVRADISEKMKEIKNYEDEYKENEKKKGKNKEEKLKEPESVSKETIELYKEIKAEKKKMEKEREKEKIRKKNNRSNNKEY